jgi:hypothetical protein
MPRTHKPNAGVIQLWVTRMCDKACFGCTQGSNLRSKKAFISLEQFEQACITLSDYFGTVGVFGGNPCLHPQFPQLCDIMTKYIPHRNRGLWANKLFGHGAIARATFNPRRCNLNVHLDKDAWDEFKMDWPEAMPFGLEQDSRHGPPYVAMQDVIPSESERWSLISECDINRYWSAMVCVFRGELRGYFCEIAGSQAMLHEDEPDYPDLGVPVERGWWKRPMADYADQVRWHCHACGVPLRGFGELSQATEGRELVSETHANIYRSKVKGREVHSVQSLGEVQPQSLGRFTHYLQNGSIKECRKPT